MSIFRLQRGTLAKPATDKPAEPTSKGPADGGLGKKIDGRKTNKHVRTKQFNTKVRDGFLEDLDRALEQFSADKGLDAVSRGYFLEVLLYNWLQVNGKEVRPYGLPALALEHAEAIAARMQWSLSQAIEDAIASRCKDLKIDLNERRRR